MKFSLSTPTASNLATLTAQATSLGFDALDLTGILPDKTNALDFGIPICCLSTQIFFSSSSAQNTQNAAELKRYIDIAAAIDCPLIRMLDPRDPKTSLLDFGDWLLPHSEHAADVGVQILVENGQCIRTAKQMWMLLDRLDRSAIACCWNLQSATQFGESPAVTVPTLNSRIQYAIIPDARFTDDLPVEKLIKRLRGIGYNGYICVGSQTPPALLPETIAKLKLWDQRLQISDAQAAAS